jgi:hypothetical protein
VSLIPTNALEGGAKLEFVIGLIPFPTNTPDSKSSVPVPPSATVIGKLIDPDVDEEDVVSEIVYNE